MSRAGRPETRMPRRSEYPESRTEESTVNTSCVPVSAPIPNFLRMKSVAAGPLLNAGHWTTPMPPLRCCQIVAKCPGSQRIRGCVNRRNPLLHMVPKTGLEPALPLQELGPQANLRPFAPQGIHVCFGWDLDSVLKFTDRSPGHPHCTRVASVWAMVLAKC